MTDLGGPGSTPASGRRFGPGWILLAAALLVGLPMVGGLVLASQWSAATRAPGHPVMPTAPVQAPKPVPNVQIIDHRGEQARLSDLQGHVVVLYFGYTQCPDVCPLALGKLAAARLELGSDGSDVRFGFITIDPGRDTYERLGVYVPSFNPEFLGFTGGPAELKALYETFGVRFEAVNAGGSAAGYSMAHTSYTYLLDQAGQLRQALPHDVTSAEIAAAVRALRSTSTG